MRRIAGCIIGFAIVGALACSDGPDITDPCEDVGVGCGVQQVDGAALFAETCGNSKCHTLEIVLTTPLASRTQAWGWISEMNAAGAKVPDFQPLPKFQEAAIVEYLCDLKGCIDGK